MTAFLERRCDQRGLLFGSYSTRDPAAGALIELFQRKRRRLAG